MNEIALIEAGLYVTGRPLTVKVIGSVLGIRSESRIKELARALVTKYKDAMSALQVIEMSDGRFIMQLKPQYAGPVKKLVTRKLLSKGPLRTIAFIAYRQPITQAYVCRVRGKPAYHHIKKLKEMGFISEEKLGRTSIIRTTEAFADYFNLSHNIKVMKKQLEAMFHEDEALK